jgi:hypothetical protein
MELTIDVIDKNAMHLLGSMEQMQLIKVRSHPPKKKLSDMFAGKLCLSDKEYEDFQTYLQNSRNEWERPV